MNLSNLNPISILKNIFNYKDLIVQLAKREIIGRYRGSYLGLLWSFLTPLSMLVVYTFVFSVVFQAKWGTSGDSKTEFALILFCGIISYSLFSEVVSRAPTLIIGNVNYVKKVVFPLEILPISVLISALVQFVISLLILIFFTILFLGIANWTWVYIPIVMLPLVLITLGVGWFLSSLGTYLRDISHIVGLGLTALMFLSPIFYPISTLPENFQILFYFNPISYVVEDMRNVVIFGIGPNWQWFFTGTAIGIVMFVLGYIWFQKTRGGFSDVL